MEHHLVSVAAIDDDRGSLDFITAALKQHPVEVLTQTDADTGLKMVLDRRPQIVLLDLIDANDERTGGSGPHYRGRSRNRSDSHHGSVLS